jgi:2-hydroxy-6-oxonona-2,4-dienedioate hydrolase
MQQPPEKLKLAPRSKTELLSIGHIGSALARAAANARRGIDGLARTERVIAPEMDQVDGLWTIVDGCRCYARAYVGQGTPDRLPIVLVHGFGISSSYFVPTAELLAPYFDVYAPDLPGHGKSDTPPQPLNIEALAASLHQWLVAMRLDRACIVGNSMGCQIAVELASRHPEQVDRLVLIGPTMDRKTRSVPRVLPKFIVGGAYEQFSLNSLLAKDYWRMASRLRYELHAMLAHHIEDTLPQLTVPVLFVRGENDLIAPQRWVNELVRVTADSRVAVIPGSGHAAHYSAAAEFIPVLVRFLRQSEPEQH